jgi:hypothetical protein
MEFRLLLKYWQTATRQPWWSMPQIQCDQIQRNFAILEKCPNLTIIIDDHKF